MTRALALTLALIAVAGCRGRFSFACDLDTECVRAGARGYCMPSPVDDKKYCAFPDQYCPSFRWDQTAPSSIAGVCVGEETLGMDMAVANSDGDVDFSIPAGADLTNLDASINVGGCGSFAGHLYGIWGASQDDIWAVGAGGHIFHYRGAAPCETQTSNVAYTLRGVWGRNVNDLYVVGDHATLLHSTDKGATWLAATNPPSSDHDFWAVAGTDTTTYAAVEQMGTPQVALGALYSSPAADGRAWTDQSAALKAVMSDLEALDTFWVSSATTLWTGGGNAETWHWTGSGWTFNAGPSAPTANGWWSGMSGVGARLLTTTNNGQIWRLDGSTWTRGFDGNSAGVCTNGLTSIFAVAGRAYAAGYSGCIAVSSDDGVTWRAFDYAYPVGGPNNPYNDNYDAIWIDPVSQLVVLAGADVNGNAVVRQNPPTP